MLGLVVLAYLGWSLVLGNVNQRNFKVYRLYAATLPWLMDENMDGLRKRGINADSVGFA